MQGRLKKSVRCPEAAFGLLWMIMVVLGLSRLWRYESTPGRAETAPSQWPVASRIQRAPGQATLILIAHPRCPCTRASLRELAKILAQCRYPVTTTILFYRPQKAPEGWEKTDLYRQAAALPGVTLMRDEEGVEARQFHAVTSGQTLLFDTEGHRLFSGGITSARGHEGDNAGEQALIALLNHRPASGTTAPTFGCSLLGASAP